jgi:hypothetical protein
MRYRTYQIPNLSDTEPIQRPSNVSIPCVNPLMTTNTPSLPCGKYEDETDTSQLPLHLPAHDDSQLLLASHPNSDGSTDLWFYTYIYRAKKVSLWDLCTKDKIFLYLFEKFFITT